MSLDNAIQNVGQYYAAHYLAEQFAKDIADQTKAWKAQGTQSVPRRLQALPDLYFRAKTRALEYPQPERRTRAPDADLRGWHAQLRITVTLYYLHHFRLGLCQADVSASTNHLIRHLPACDATCEQAPTDIHGGRRLCALQRLAGPGVSIKQRGGPRDTAPAASPKRRSSSFIAGVAKLELRD